MYHCAERITPNFTKSDIQIISRLITWLMMILILIFKRDIFIKLLERLVRTLWFMQCIIKFSNYYIWFHKDEAKLHVQPFGWWSLKNDKGQHSFELIKKWRHSRNEWFEFQSDGSCILREKWVKMAPFT